MIRMMMAVIGNPSAARHARHQHTMMLHKLIGFAIVTSGLAVIAAQALQRVAGG